MGMDLVSLKGLNEFITNYEKLAYKSGHVEDDTIKQNLTTRMPDPIPDNIHVMIKNKNCEIAKQTIIDACNGQNLYRILLYGYKIHKTCNK